MKNFVVLFVCTGNICRSPMAEGIMKDLILDQIDSQRQFMPIEIISAGTYGASGHSASRHAVDIATKHKINLGFHRSRHLTQNLATFADIIFVMETNHKDYIKEKWPEINYVHELKAFGHTENELPETIDVLDPIGREYDVYEEVFDEIKSEVERVAPKVFELAQEKYREG